MAQPKVATIFLMDLLPSGMPANLWKRFAQLCGEAMFLMSVALLVPLVLGLKQGGMIALFLVSASLLRRMRMLLDENRDNIWVYNLGSWKSNTISTVSILAIFCGLFLGNLLFALVLTFLNSNTASFFSVIVEVKNLHLPLEKRFSSFLSILLNNYFVLFTTILIALIYRTYAMVLIISWNACIWAVALLYMFQKSWTSTKVSGAEFLSRSIAAVFPHLILEALAYILGALAAIFLSRGFTKYNMDDVRFKSVFHAFLYLLILACALIPWAAFIEATLPRLILSGL